MSRRNATYPSPIDVLMGTLTFVMLLATTWFLAFIL